MCHVETLINGFNDNMEGVVSDSAIADATRVLAAAAPELERLRAVDSLVAAGSAEAVDALAVCLRSSDNAVVSLHAARGLASFGDEGVAALTALLADSHARPHAAVALAQADDPTARRLLQAFLDEKAALPPALSVAGSWIATAMAIIGGALMLLLSLVYWFASGLGSEATDERTGMQFMGIAFCAAVGVLALAAARLMASHRSVGRLLCAAGLLSGYVVTGIMGAVNTGRFWDGWAVWSVVGIPLLLAALIPERWPWSRE